MNNKKILIIIIIILGITTISMGSYIIYNEINNINNTENNNIIQNENDINTENNNNNENKNNNIENNNNSTSDKIQDTDNINLSNQYLEKIINGFWYKNGVIFHFSKSGYFGFGKYGSEGIYGGNIISFKEVLNVNALNTDKHIFELEVFSEACTDNCIKETDAYSLKIELEYDENYINIVNVIKLVKITNGISEELDSLEGIYNFAGNNYDEVDQYEESLRNNNN